MLNNLSAWGITHTTGGIFLFYAYRADGSRIDEVPERVRFEDADLDQKMIELAHILGGMISGSGWFVVRSAELDLHLATVEFGVDGYEIHPSARYWKDGM